MPKFEIYETDEFRKSLKKLDKHVEKNIDSKLTKYVFDILINEPHFGPNIKMLKGYSSNVCRYRIGDYRIMYSIDDDSNSVFFLTIGHRKDIYR